MNHDDSKSAQWKVDEAQREQWNKSSKPLLDGGQGKQDRLDQSGRLERPARKAKHAVGGAPSGKSQKERLAEERQRRTVKVQMRRKPK